MTKSRECSLSWPPESESPELSVLVVIVNYKTPDLTINCLTSLHAEALSTDGITVTIADNCSGDGSAERIGREIELRGWSFWARVVALPHNGGFAYGNNKGIEASPAARFILLLNSDTIVHPGCVRHCLEAMAAEPSAGVMSCNVLNRDGTVQNVCRRFPTPLKTMICTLGLPWKLPWLFGWAITEDLCWDRATTSRNVDWLGGAFLFIRREVLTLAGGLDEEFFFYGEDVEFSYRLKKLGYGRLYKPGATITHLGGASSDPSRMPAADRSVHHWRGRYLVQRKCYGSVAAAAVRTVDVIMLTLRLGVERLAGRQGEAGFAQRADTLRMLLRPLRSSV